MKLSKFKIKIIHSFKREVRLIGHFGGESKEVVRQVIVRRGKKPTALSLKKSPRPGWALEILLPPRSFAVFSALVENAPTECRFDRKKKARRFEIGYAIAPNKRAFAGVLVLR